MSGVTYNFSVFASNSYGDGNPSFIQVQLIQVSPRKHLDHMEHCGEGQRRERGGKEEGRLNRDGRGEKEYGWEVRRGGEKEVGRRREVEDGGMGSREGECEVGRSRLIEGKGGGNEWGRRGNRRGR